MKWIEFGEFDYKIIIPLIYPFFYEIRELFHKNNTKSLFISFTNFCGYLLSGIIYLIVKCRSRRLKSGNLGSSDNLEYNIDESPTNQIKRKISTYIYGDNQVVEEMNKIKKKKVRSKYLFILLLTCIYLVPMLLDSFISLNEDIILGTSSSISLFFCIFFTIAFSKIILGSKIYFHHIFSSIIIVFCVLVVFIIYCVETNFSVETLLNILLILIITGLYALFNVLEKKFFNKYMSSPYHFMFILGLFAFTFILLYEIITVLIFGIDWQYNGIFYQFGKNIENYESLYILHFLGDILSAFIWLAGIQLTVYFFTPYHFIISESLSQIVSTIIKRTINDYPVYERVIIYIFFVIIIFATLIYNEIIILNFWNLNENTKHMILLRQGTENEDIKQERSMDTIYEDENYKMVSE